MIGIRNMLDTPIQISILLKGFNLFTNNKTLIFLILIKFLFCYKSSFCSPILKLSISKYSSVTKVQFVHQYQNPHFCNIDQISILLQKFILFTHIEAFYLQIFICDKSSICSPVSKLAFQSVHQHWTLHFFKSYENS